MSSVSYFLCLLILISFSTFHLSISQSMYNGQQVEKVSGEDNVVGEIGTYVLSKFRFLLGLKSSNSHRQTYSLSPAPAPAEEALAPSPAILFHTHIYTRSPLHHKSHTSPPLNSEDGRSDHGAKAKHRRITIGITVGAVLLVIFGVAILLFYKWCQRRRAQPLGGKSKVSYDPGPELFYLNTLAPILDIESKHSSESKIVLSNETVSSFRLSQVELPMKCGSDSPISSNEEVVNLPFPNMRFSLKHFPESRNPVSNESVLSFDPLKNGETMKCEPDAVSCLDEEILHVDNLTSDDDKSFHSICNSHSSADLCSVVSEASLSCPSGKWSPLSSSYRSTSSDFKPIQFPTIHPPRAPTSKESRHPFPLRSNKSPFSPSQNFRITRCKAPFLSHIDDRKPLRSSRSSFPCNDDSKEAHSTNLEMTLLANNSICTSPVIPVSSAPSKPPMPPPQPSKLLSSSTATGKPPQPPPLPSVSNGNIPMPPPPPLPPSRAMSSHNGGSSGHPPPPPPFQSQQSAAVGKDGTPLPKLKPLHWDKVRAAPEHSMVWDKIRSSSFELDEKMIESLFGYKLQSNMKTEEAKNKSTSPGKHVLDHKRLQNITILMKALNATDEQVCQALIQGRGLSAEQLEALSKMMPTKEEAENLANFKGDINELGSAEILVKAILDIPFAFSRIQVMLYRENFEDEVVHLKKSFAMLEEACKELRSSRLFFRLLEAVLKTGNRMNVGTIRGGARAFKLDTLLKLSDVKGTDGKTTLLHFVVQEIIRSEGVSAMERSTKKNKPKTADEREEDYRVMGLDIVSGLSTELCNVKKTASVDLDVLESSVSTLSDGANLLKHLIEVDISNDEDNGSFANSMRLFLIRAEKTIKKLKEDEDRVLLHVREITEYYHGHVSKDEANPLRIFVIVRDFLGMLDCVCKEVRSLKSHNPAASFR